MLGFLESPKNRKNGFIEGVAKDYGLDYHLVENIFKRCDNTLEFYKQLEYELK